MSGPSITSWNRLEPRPRTESIARALAAQVRDPLWILTRQWQFGEFQGQDAASPAWVQFSARFSAMEGWNKPGGASTPYQRDATPLEAATEREPFTPDDATAVELGQRFELLLTRAFAAAPVAPAVTLDELVRQFRAAHSLANRPLGPTDRAAILFRRVCGRRAMDGCALYQAVRNVDVPASPAVVDAAALEIIRSTVQTWRTWVQSIWGDLAKADPTTWQPGRLEYAVEVSATTPAGGRATLAAHPGRDGAYEWYAFDEQSVTNLPACQVRQETRNLLPAAVQFRGMPHARWWQFQDRVADLGEIQPELPELAKVVLMDFMFVHSNDWFVVPFTQEVGTLCRIDRLIVHDVFGGRTLIDRADRRESATQDPTRRWSMFATTSTAHEGGLADYFVLPASAGSATLSGEPIELVRFIRDEMANMVWAIETTTENGLGQPWSGRERTRPGVGPPASPASSGDDTLRYRIQSAVPENWIPFVPVKVSVSGQVELERTALLRPPQGPNGVSSLILPAGRILSPPDPYRIREEEVPRGGVAVSRVIRRARWIDGSTHLWIARRKQTGRGEGSSGLRFDAVVTPPA